MNKEEVDVLVITAVVVTHRLQETKKRKQMEV